MKQKKRTIDNQERVLIALSGGVDSSTAAALLKEAGYRVEGAIMVFEGLRHENMDLADRVARQLGIPLHHVDLREEFDDVVIRSFAAEYARGRTPNPCVLCNAIMKFDLLPKKAGAQSAKTATGHYARIQEDHGRYLLKRGKDKNEQSYFLYRLDQKQLARTLFPLGEYTKEEVRTMARRRGLPTATCRKSQDACFIPQGNYAALLQRILPQEPGPVLNREGKMLGQHKGIIHYTIGQRHGIGISHKHPYYVTRIDVDDNTIYVGDRKDVFKRKLIAANLNFIPFDVLEQNIEVTAKVRYLSLPSEARVEPLSPDQVKVIFTKPQWAITPGQSVVFYHNDLVIGGGLIVRVLD